MNDLFDLIAGVSRRDLKVLSSSLKWSNEMMGLIVLFSQVEEELDKIRDAKKRNTIKTKIYLIRKQLNSISFTEDSLIEKLGSKLGINTKRDRVKKNLNSFSIRLGR